MKQEVKVGICGNIDFVNIYQNLGSQIDLDIVLAKKSKEYKFVLIDDNNSEIKKNLGELLSKKQHYAMQMSNNILRLDIEWLITLIERNRLDFSLLNSLRYLSFSCCIKEWIETNFIANFSATIECTKQEFIFYLDLIFWFLGYDAELSFEDSLLTLKNDVGSISLNITNEFNFSLISNDVEITAKSLDKINLKREEKVTTKQFPLYDMKLVEIGCRSHEIYHQNKWQLFPVSDTLKFLKRIREEKEIANFFDNM